MSLLKWLYPGMKVKRWVLLFLAGVALLALGIAYALVHLYREYPLPPLFYYLTLQFIPRLGRSILLATVGLALAVVAMLQLNRSLLSALHPSGPGSVTEVLYRRRTLERGPKVVAIGGGTGLSTLLRGLKEHTANLTAIVTVADDGGSSGRLRRELGVLPPGDFRQCIAALADSEPLMSQLMEYRFGDGTGLKGHSLGNLFIVAMSGITGSFEDALRQSSRVLAVRGRVLPSALQQVTLGAERADDSVVHGESQVPHRGVAIRRVFLQPADVSAYPEAIRAILEADLIVVGPGSLYTSVLPNLLVRDIVRAIEASPAFKVYVCNVASQPGETDGYSLGDYLEALQTHVANLRFDVVLANDNFTVTYPDSWGVHPVRLDVRPGVQLPLLVTADLVDVNMPTRHDPRKLATQLMRLYERRRGRQWSTRMIEKVRRTSTLSP